MRRLRELLLWAGAALGLLAVAAGLAVAFGGFSFLIFRSGSMSPEIPTGGIALSRTVGASDIRPGDVVSVTAASGDRITHRVVSSTLRGDEATLVLKGDANATEDSEVYVVTSAERVVASLPYGGYVVAHALTPPGILAMGCLSLMLIVLTTGGGDERPAEPRGPRTRPSHRRRAPARRRVVAGVVVLGMAAGAGATIAHTTGTWAVYTDRPTALTGQLTSFAMAAITATCVDNNSNVVLSVPTVATPGRTVTYDATISNGATLTVTGTGATRSVQVTNTQAPGALLGRRTYTVTITARANTAAGWTSATTYQISTSAVIVGSNMSCDGPV